jgi:hypothetical protein
MVQYIGAGRNNRPERSRITLKIGNQHLDEDAGDLGPDTLYRLREKARPAIRDIITGNGGYHHVAQSHAMDSFRHPGPL